MLKNKQNVLYYFIFLFNTWTQGIRLTKVKLKLTEIKNSNSQESFTV